VREPLPETQPVPRALLCAESQIQSSRHRDALREQKIELSAQKKPAVQSAQGRFARAKDRALGTEKTRGTDILCRDGTEQPLGTASDSRHRRTVPRAAEAGPQHSRDLTTQSNGRWPGRWPGRQMCREPTYGSRHRNLCRVPDKGFRQRIKKSNSHIQTFRFINLHPYKKHMLKFHIKIDIYFVFNNFISF
jgi:hypothetical protein